MTAEVPMLLTMTDPVLVVAIKAVFEPNVLLLSVRLLAPSTNIPAVRVRVLATVTALVVLLSVTVGVVAYVLLMTRVPKVVAPVMVCAAVVLAKDTLPLLYVRVEVPFMFQLPNTMRSPPPDVERVSVPVAALPILTLPLTVTVVVIGVTAILNVDPSSMVRLPFIARAVVVPLLAPISSVELLLICTLFG